jgi:hypothetical protein
MTRQRLLIIIGVLLWGLMTHSTNVGTGDEPHYLAVAHSIAFDRDLDVANNYGGDEWIVGAEPGAHAAPGRGGALRPVHDIGLPLLFAPFVLVVRPATRAVLGGIPAPWLERTRLQPETLYRHLLSAGMIALALLLADRLCATLLALGFRKGVAFATVLLVALSPPLLVHSITFFSELLTALITLLVFEKVVVGAQSRTAAWAIAGGLTGFLLLVHARNVGLVAGLLAVIWVVWRQQAVREHALAFLTSFLALSIARVALTYYLWGTWFTTQHVRTGEWVGFSETASIMLQRLAGLVVDQEYGLLIYAPVFALIAFSMPHWRERFAAVAAVIVTLCYLLPILIPLTNVHGWTGGWSPAARFWVPVVPLLAIPLALAVARTPKAVVGTVVALQIVISAYFWENPKNLWNDGDGTAAVCERGSFTWCDRLPSFVQSSDAVPNPVQSAPD